MDYVTEIVIALNDLTPALDTKQHCAAVFINIAKMIDSVDHSILLNRSDTRVSGHSLISFSNYLFNKVQCVNLDLHLSQLYVLGIP